MQDDHAWDRIADAIDSRYGISAHGRSERPVADAVHLKEKVAHIEFTRDGVDYRLERVTGPAILERRTIGARRAGADVRFENIYDPTQIGHKTLLFRKEAGEWTPLNPEELGLA